MKLCILNGWMKHVMLNFYLSKAGKQEKEEHVLSPLTDVTSLALLPSKAPH